VTVLVVFFARLAKLLRRGIGLLVPFGLVVSRDISSTYGREKGNPIQANRVMLIVAAAKVHT